MKPKLGVDFFERGFFEKNNKKVIKKLDSFNRNLTCFCKNK